MASDPFPFDEHHAATAAPTVPPETYPPGRSRHPLGLPQGSVRAVLILMIMGTIWTLLAMPGDREIRVPIYLYYLLFLTTGSYFAARSRSAVTAPHESPPLYLPRGTIRGLIVIGFIGILGYAIFQDPTGFFSRPLLSNDDKQHATLLLPVAMIGGFLLGVIVSCVSSKMLAGPTGMPAWYQDVQAWVSLLAVLGLGAQVILELVVFPSMTAPPSLPQLQLVLSAIIAFYFGARA
jgi:hypothetical protein